MKTVNPFLFDRSLEIQVSTRTVSGDITDSWAAGESDVRAEIIFSGANDKNEDDQPLNIERRRYKIMTSGRSFNVNASRFRETGTTEWFYVTGFYPWRGSKHVSIIEGINRSND